MSKNTYPCELPRDVVSITRPKETPHRRNWILLAPRDNECEMVSVHIDEKGKIHNGGAGVIFSYLDLFEHLGNVASSRGSTWVLTFRSRYVLKQAGFLAALQGGSIQLERQLRLAGKQAGRGCVCLSHGFTELDLRIGKRKIKLLDWSNFGVSPIDYTFPGEQNTAANCLLVFADWICQFAKIGLSASRTSAAQIGWAKLRQSLGNGEIFTSLDPEIRALERRCYYGGRCEPFRLGEIPGRCYSMDIRACYANICAHLKLPARPVRYFPDGCDPCEFGSGTIGVGAADVVVETGSPVFPLRHQGKVIYPTGRFLTSLCGLELSAAVDIGCVRKVLRAVRYADLPILVDYARWYMKARDTVETCLDGCCTGGLKAAFNSSLGFIARQGREWFEWEPAGSPPWWFGVTTDPDDHASIVSAHTLDSDSELLRIGSEPRNCAPIVHAAICAAARVKLLALMDVAGPNNVYYCDTDGLIVSQSGYDNLLATKSACGENYGQLGIRHEANGCVINGQKNYRIGEHVVCAGLPRANRGKWKPNETSQTDCGYVDRHGNVSPFLFSCEDMCDEKPKYKNHLRQPVAAKGREAGA